MYRDNFRNLLHVQRGGGGIYTPVIRGTFCEEASIVNKTEADAAEDALEMTDTLSRTSHVPLVSLWSLISYFPNYDLPMLLVRSSTSTSYPMHGHFLNSIFTYSIWIWMIICRGRMKLVEVSYLLSRTKLFISLIFVFTPHKYRWILRNLKTIFWCLKR